MRSTRRIAASLQASLPLGKFKYKGAYLQWFHERNIRKYANDLRSYFVAASIFSIKIVSQNMLKAAQNKAFTI